VWTLVFASLPTAFTASIFSSNPSTTTTNSLSTANERLGTATKNLDDRAKKAEETERRFGQALTRLESSADGLDNTAGKVQRAKTTLDEAADSTILSINAEKERLDTALTELHSSLGDIGKAAATAGRVKTALESVAGGYDTTAEKLRKGQGQLDEAVKKLGETPQCIETTAESIDKAKERLEAYTKGVDSMANALVRRIDNAASGVAGPTPGSSRKRRRQDSDEAIVLDLDNDAETPWRMFVKKAFRTAYNYDIDHHDISRTYILKKLVDKMASRERIAGEPNHMQAFTMSAPLNWQFCVTGVLDRGHQDPDVARGQCLCRGQACARVTREMGEEGIKLAFTRANAGNM
jgi:prefoldin subunit 5